MTNTSYYMSILAKVMRNKSMSDTCIDKGKYNKLYYMIHDNFNNQLQKSLYPYSSNIIQKCEDMLDAMESLYICPEMIGKKCLLVSNYVTTNIFSVCESLFLDKESVRFCSKIYTQIPFIIVNAEAENKIEVLNYANIRISLTEHEFKFLLIESGKRKIALNKIIQYVFLSTKLTDPDLCIISDNVYAIAEKMFLRATSKCVAHIDAEGAKKITRRHLDGFTALIMNDEVMINTRNDNTIRKYHSITYDELVDYIEIEVKPVLYGFLDEFLSIKTQILTYYDEQQIHSKNNLQEVIGDIVRLGDSGDSTLQSIRSFEESRNKKLKIETKILSSILEEIEESISEICNDLGESHITGKQISRHILDDIFESIFRCKDFNKGLGKKLLSRLYSFEYDNYDLVSAYAQNISGMKVDFTPIKIEKYEWEKAKMLLYILEPEKIPEEYLRLYVETLGERCSTGKELYAKALVSSERNMRILLQDSLDKGYEKAGLILLEKYKNGDRNVNLLSLVNALVPEACMLLANQKIRRYRNNKRYVDLSDEEFTYYKIAATKQHLPAIGTIVDIVFESRFSSGFQIPKDELLDSKHEKMIDNGHVICQLCYFLISKMYQVDHYREILGIVLFSLNEDLSSAMSYLTNANSGLAYYCRGNMYEFGRGVATDLDKATENYKKAIKKGFSGKAERRLAKCNDKKSRYIYEKQSNNYYQENKPYRQKSTPKSTIPVNDGCFAPRTRILMADGSYRNVEFVKANDIVMVYDHYEGILREEKIIANIHDIAIPREHHVISMVFENDKILKIVKSHVIFDCTQNQYVWIDDENIGDYIGHSFAIYDNKSIIGCKLLNYSIETEVTNYYTPISRFHLNVFAEGFLTMPPTKLTANMFRINNDMSYDLSVIDKVGKTSYEEIKDFVSIEEYYDLPCEYLASVIAKNQCKYEDFEYAMTLYREQSNYVGK